MLRHVLRIRVAVGAVAAFGFVLFLTLSVPGQPSNPAIQPGELPAPDAAAVAAQHDVSTDEAQGPAAGQSYVGSNQCFICHRPETSAWSETNHAHAFEHLPEKYQSDAECLQCHVTGYDQPRGYVAGTDKDLKMVGCESCHGPGALHVNAVQEFLQSPTDDPSAEQRLRETIVRSPTDSVCIACHKTQAHGHHPWYEGRPSQKVSSESPVQCTPAWTTAYRSASTAGDAQYSSKYNIKTCGSCHYGQYTQWRTEKHSALSAMLSPEHRTDQECQKCHATADAAAATSTSGTGPHSDVVGVACESCHGPALEHVRFNVQFISSPPLGPKLEQAARNSISKGKPRTTCVQCHVGERHKRHPEFDRRQ